MQPDYLVEQWLATLREYGSAAGFPLILVGLGLMAFGWRMWKVCVALSMGTAALLGVLMFAPSSEYRLYTALGAGLVAGAISWWPAKYALSALGGLVGAFCLGGSLSVCGLDGPVLWASMAVLFVACAAMSHLNRQRVVILLTATMGSVLLSSGVVAFAQTMPALYGTFSGLASTYAMVVPFVFLVPLVMSCFYQLAEIHRLRAEV